MVFSGWRETAIGPVCVCDDGNAVMSIDLGKACEGAVASVLTDQALDQLEEYLRGERQLFDLPLAPKGTAFQTKVWEALRRIPYGETRSYGEIAKEIGCPGGSRAVGMANHNNPILIVIPCHRVIGSNGSLTGYGAGLPLKKRLLMLEKGGTLPPEE